METRKFLRELEPCAIDEAHPDQRRRPYFVPFVLTFCILAVVWMVFSGKFDAFHLSLGGISCALVAWLSSDMLFPPHASLGDTVLSWGRFSLYLPWLLKEIFFANFHLLKLSFHPRMMDLIDPQVFKFNSELKGRMALLTMANSITLTPGTITVNVSVTRKFTIHAIDTPSADALPGEMQKKVALAFGERRRNEGG